MNKFFYIFYLCPFFISITLFAQELSRPKQKNIDKQPLLANLDDDGLEELKNLANAADLGAAPAGYHTELLSPQTTAHTSQQSSAPKQSLPRYLSLEKTGIEAPPVLTVKTNSKGFSKLIEDDDGDFDPRSTSNQQVSPPPVQLFEPSVDYSPYTTTSHTTHSDLYPPLEQISAPQPVVQQAAPVAYGQPISTQQVAQQGALPSAPDVDHNPFYASTTVRPVGFNPFEVPQEQIATPQPAAQQQNSGAYGQPISSNQVQQGASYAVQHAVQAPLVASSTTQQQVPAQTLLPPEYSTKSVIVSDESIKIKKQAHDALIVLIDTHYIRMEDDEVCANMRKALMVQITRLRKLLPHESSNIDKWFLNLPIDIDGHTMAHLAAANLDPKFLQMLHMMGVDIFRPNRFNTSPEDTAGKCILEKAHLTPAQKKLLLPDEVGQENSGRRRVRKLSTANTATSSTSVEEQKKQEKYDEKKRLEQLERSQKNLLAFYKRHQKVLDYFDRVKNTKK